MTKFNFVDWLAMVLVIIGGLNWGLIGLLNFDLVAAIFGMGSMANVIYGLVGLAALYMIYMVIKMAGYRKDMPSQ